MFGPRKITSSLRPPTTYPHPLSQAVSCVPHRTAGLRARLKGSRPDHRFRTQCCSLVEGEELGLGSPPAGPSLGQGWLGTWGWGGGPARTHSALPSLQCRGLSKPARDRPGCKCRAPREGLDRVMSAPLPLPLQSRHTAENMLRVSHRTLSSQSASRPAHPHNFWH